MLKGSLAGGLALTSLILMALLAAFSQIDPAYDRKYTAMKDLKKMPILEELLQSSHCEDHTYLFELFSCGDPNCKFGCEQWPTVDEGSPEAQLQAELKRRTPLPRRKGKDWMTFAETIGLQDNDERDLPSASKKMPPSLLKKRKGLDKPFKEIFVQSKVRDAIICADCGRPRIIFSKTAPKKKELEVLDAYKEEFIYICGDPLFDADDVAEGDEEFKALAAKFHVQQACKLTLPYLAVM